MAPLQFCITLLAWLYVLVAAAGIFTLSWPQLRQSQMEYQEAVNLATARVTKLTGRGSTDNYFTPADLNLVDRIAGEYVSGQRFIRWPYTLTGVIAFGTGISIASVILSILIPAC